MVLFFDWGYNSKRVVERWKPISVLISIDYSDTFIQQHTSFTVDPPGTWFINLPRLTLNVSSVFKAQESHTVGLRLA